MKLLMMLILCSCAHPRVVKTTTTTITTTRYEQPTVISTPTVSDLEYDFSEIDQEIDSEEQELEALPDSSLEIDENMDRFEAEVTLGKTVVKK